MDNLSHSWCWTEHNLEEQWMYSVHASYLVFQLEQCPETGNFHYQGFIQFHARKRFSTVRKLLGRATHIEKMRGTAEEASNYCKKPESRMDGPYEYGTLMHQGERTDIQAAIDLAISGGIKQVAVQNPLAFLRCYRGLQAMLDVRQEVAPQDGPPLVYVITGPTGVGKSRLVHEICPPDTLYTVYLQPMTAWFDNYHHANVVFDDYAGELSMSLLLRLLDRYPMQVQRKGGFLNWAPKRVFFTQQMDLLDCYPTSNPDDRRALDRRITKRIVLFEGHTVTAMNFDQ